MLPGLLLVACREPATTDTAGTTDSGTTTGTVNPFPLPEDIDTIDFETAFVEAVRQMVAVNAQHAFLGHATTLDTRSPGCPDFWTEPFTSGGVQVSRDDGVAWNDDCLNAGGDEYDGWLWWDTIQLSVNGDPASYDGRVTEGTRTIEGNATVIADALGDDPKIRFEFDGTATDTLYRVEAYGYESVTYNSLVDATVTGTDVFRGTATPDGYRADLAITLANSDLDQDFTARGDVYLFSEVFLGRFDSIGVDMALQGPIGAGPDQCTLEPLGWIGLRDAEALWYDVVFQPRTEEDLVEIDFPNEPLSVCDGCGKLYVQGVEQVGREICVDFSFLFERNAVTLPDAEDFALPWRGLAP